MAANTSTAVGVAELREGSGTALPTLPGVATISATF